MIICGNCGHQNEDTARFCMECSAKFDGSEGAAKFIVVEKEKTVQQDDPFVSIPDAAPIEVIKPKEKSSVEGISPEVEAKIESVLSAKTGEGLYAVAVPRNPLLVLLFCVITCYLPYYVYWWYMVSKEIKAALNREDINPKMELILNIVTCSLFSIWLSYKYPKLMLEMEQRVKVPPKDISVLSTVLTLISFGPIAAYLIQTDLNRIWESAEERNLVYK